MTEGDLPRRENGKFEIAPGLLVAGELTYGSADARLSLFHEEQFAHDSYENDCVLGTLANQKRVSLLDCIPLTHSIHSSRGSGTGMTASYLPQFVIVGGRTLSPRENIIKAITVCTSDLHALFNDHFAFGSVLNDADVMRFIAETNTSKRAIEVGDRPIVQYFSGRRQFAEYDITLGKLKAWHRTTSGPGSVAGVSIQNQVALTLHFEDRLSFDDAFSRIYELMYLLKVLIGKGQKIEFLQLDVSEDGDKYGEFLEVFWTFAADLIQDQGSRAAHFFDVLIKPLDHGGEFEPLIRQWFERHEAWRLPRKAVIAGLNPKRFDRERLTRAANPYDFLPESAVPENVELAPALEEAKARATEIFEGLAWSAERDSVLSALGRVGKPSLPKKVGHRAGVISALADAEFPELGLVVRHAVKCRNFFVHGSTEKLEYSRHHKLVWFLTNTLEFVFCVSDLIECGWDLRRWIDEGDSYHHPFGSYRQEYRRNLEHLRSLVAAPRS